MTTVLGQPASPAASGLAGDGGQARSRREEFAIAIFGSWMLIGLYLDGWAHNVDKPETFFSPWHGVLYSGFVAALIWFGVEGIRSGVGVRQGLLGGGADRVTVMGLGLFVTGAIGDGVWHEVFGIEVDLEALLSPTHLLLLVGGFMMLTTPLRAAYADPEETAATLRSFLPAILSATLAAALVSFFTMYLSAFWGVGTYWVEGGEDVRELVEIEGVGSVLVTNLILMAPLIFLLRRWRPPLGTFTILFGAVGLSMTGIEEFERIELAVPAIIGGLAADLLIRWGASVAVIASVTPLVLWSSFFAAVELGDGIEWAAELVAGSVVLAVMSGVLLATITGRQPALPQ